MDFNIINIFLVFLKVAMLKMPVMDCPLVQRGRPSLKQSVNDQLRKTQLRLWLVLFQRKYESSTYVIKGILYCPIHY